MKVALVCRLLGHCRQAFYQSKADIAKEVERERILIGAVLEIRNEDPRIGGYKLWLMLISMFGRDYVPGRDRFFVIMRRKGLMLPKPKPRHTTNSNHRYHKWKNQIKNFSPTAANQLGGRHYLYIVGKWRRVLLASDNRCLFPYDCRVGVGRLFESSCQHPGLADGHRTSHIHMWKR